MGLIKAGIGALGGVLADQWKEFFVCDSLPDNVLAVKGIKQSTDRGSNKKGSDNVISNGSGIVVADGQCMIIVEQGKVVEVCAEPGQFTYNSATEPSIFAGFLGRSILDSFKAIGKRFTYGGETGTDQRVYYINTKEIKNNMFGTPNPVPFRIVDRNVNLDFNAHVTCHGVYSYQIADPIIFYTNVCTNFAGSEYRREEIDRQVKAELISAMRPAFAKISAKQIRPDELLNYEEDVYEALDESLTVKWGERFGLKLKSVAIASADITKEDSEILRDAQVKARFRDMSLAGAEVVASQTEAMKTAAANPNGAMMGFMGMNMAQQAGGLNAQNLFAMGQQQQMQQTPANGWKCVCGATAQGKFCMECGKPKPEPKRANGWRCACGAENEGKFCIECGKPKPAADGWICACGAVNKGKFCMECGKPKPAGEPLYKCDKCGWEPADPKHPPKFCPECGDTFDANDVK